MITLKQVSTDSKVAHYLWSSDSAQPQQTRGTVAGESRNRAEAAPLWDPLYLALQNPQSQAEVSPHSSPLKENKRKNQCEMWSENDFLVK
jgi:hypothetical protein